MRNPLHCHSLVVLSSLCSKQNVLMMKFHFITPIDISYQCRPAQVISQDFCKIFQNSFFRKPMEGYLCYLSEECFSILKSFHEFFCIKTGTPRITLSWKQENCSSPQGKLLSTKLSPGKLPPTKLPLESYPTEKCPLEYCPHSTLKDSKENKEKSKENCLLTYPKLSLRKSLPQASKKIIPE